MSTDASKFSLSETSQRLNPWLEDMIFKRVGDYFRKIKPTCNGKVKCRFMISPDHLKVPLGYDRNTFARAIAQVDSIAYSCMHDLRDAKEYNEILLLMDKEGHWLVWKSVYIQQDGSFFFSTDSVINRVDDAGIRRLAAHDDTFPTRFRLGIRELFVESIDRRKFIADKLTHAMTHMVAEGHLPQGSE
jgi:hypothetical protein